MHVENWMMRLRQTIERQHPENGAQRGAENGQLEGHGNESWPAIERAAADIHRIGDGGRPILKTETTDAAGEAAEKRDEGHHVALQPHSLRKTFHREWSVGVHAAIAGFTGLLDRMNELFRS